MNNLVDVIIPTWDNQHYLQGALESLLINRSSESLFHVFVVNNGHPNSCDWVQHPNVTVIQTGGENLGWEGGLKAGLAQSKAPFVCFFNDDAQIPPASTMWLNKLLQHFRNLEVGAVGPSSNVVMGFQNIFVTTQHVQFERSFLVGFCILLRRSTLDQVGGVDDSLPGGDDLDLSIRLRDAGYTLICDREVFVYHHGFKTGERVHGAPDKIGGWNSYEFKEKTDLALISKHGFKKWWECLKGAYTPPTIDIGVSQEDVEGNLIRERVIGEKILELGVGGNKTVERAVGIDLIPKGEPIETLAKIESVADIVASVAEPLPVEDESQDCIIARHILEHMQDPILSLKNWAKAVKKGGKVIVAVPLQSIVDSIPMNIEHLVSFDEKSMRTLFETVGLQVNEQVYSGNGVSFITVGEKI